MDSHEASEASGAEPEPDLEKIVSRWAGESRQLLVALPVVLARLQELKEERETLRSRLMDLEQENLTLRESREHLTETFAKLKELIAGTALDETRRHLGLELVERASPARPEPSATKAPVRSNRAGAARPGRCRPLRLTAEPAPPVSGQNPAPVRLTPVFRPPTKN